MECIVCYNDVLLIHNLCNTCDYRICLNCLIEIDACIICRKKNTNISHEGILVLKMEDKPSIYMTTIKHPLLTPDFINVLSSNVEQIEEFENLHENNSYETLTEIIELNPEPVELNLSETSDLQEELQENTDLQEPVELNFPEQEINQNHENNNEPIQLTLKQQFYYKNYHNSFTFY